MPLSNAQYDEIMREYDERQLNNRRIRDARRTEIAEKIPRIREIDALTASSSVQKARLYLSGDTSAITSLKTKLAELAEERRQLLVSNGYPMDYLDYWIPAALIKCRILQYWWTKNHPNPEYFLFLPSFLLTGHDKWYRLT